MLKLWIVGSESQVGKAHSHPYAEILGFVGTDPEDPSDLGGEVEFWIDGECHRLTKSTMVFLPPNLPHCPLMTVRSSNLSVTPSPAATASIPLSKTPFPPIPRISRGLC